MATQAQVKEESGLIKVKIQYDEANIGQHKLSFQTERKMPLRRIFLDFCDRLDLVYGATRFYLDDKSIGEMQTAEEHQMEEGDLIDAFNEQYGAGPNYY